MHGISFGGLDIHGILGIVIILDPYLTGTEEKFDLAVQSTIYINLDVLWHVRTNRT
jgi:hypothetical protein